MLKINQSRLRLFGLMGVGLLLICMPLLAQQATSSEQSNGGVASSNPVETESDTKKPTTTSDETTGSSLLDISTAGGMLMLPIGLCSLALCMFVFERAMSLRKGRVIPRPFVKRFVSQMQTGELSRGEASRLCKENKSPVASVCGAAVRKWGQPAQVIEAAIADEGERVGNRLRRSIRMFNGISTITPLLGLLGTVIGMIRAFNAIVTTGAMGKPELLAAGISQALITTAAGLCVAIPALIAYLYFTSRVDHLLMEMDSIGQQMVDSISLEARKRSEKRRVIKQPAKRAA